MKRLTIALLVASMIGPACRQNAQRPDEVEMPNGSGEEETMTDENSTTPDLQEVHHAFMSSDGAAFAGHYAPDAAMVLSNGTVVSGSDGLQRAATKSGASVREWSVSDARTEAVEHGGYLRGESRTRLALPDGKELDIAGQRLIAWNAEGKIIADLSIPGGESELPPAIAGRSRELETAWNEHDVEAALGLFTVDALYVLSDGRYHRGGGLREMLDFAFGAKLQGMKVTPKRAWIAGEDAVYVASDYRFAITPNGEQVELAGCRVDVWKRVEQEWRIAVQVAQPEGSEACLRGEFDGSVSKNGVDFRWRIAGDRLVGEMSAPTSGWVAVGFNDRDQLRGARLVMGRIRGGTPEVEEHLAAPPDHAPPAVGSRARVLDGTETSERTAVRFSLPLSGDGHGPDLKPGEEHHLVVAFSDDDDFGHHSAMRTSLRVRL